MHKNAPPDTVTLLDTREAARRLSLAPETIRLLVRRGEIPVVRIGRAVRFRIADLEMFIEARVGTGGLRLVADQRRDGRGRFA